jgi:hypothetical protein
MGARKKEQVLVKRVRPYPIPAKVTKSETSPPIEGQILRVTKLGFQMEFVQLLFSVGEIYSAEFVIPFFEKTIKENVKIVRTMDRYLDQKATIKGYLVEMHFTNLSRENAKSIAEFESAINQRS